MSRTLEPEGCMCCSSSPVTCKVSFLKAVKSSSSHPATHPPNGGTLCTDSPLWIFHFSPFETNREQEIMGGGEREERSSAPSKAKYVLVLSLFHENRKADIKTVMGFLLFILIKQKTTWFWLLIKQCWCSQWSMQQWYSWVTKTYKELRRVKAAESMLRLRIV